MRELSIAGRRIAGCFVRRVRECELRRASRVTPSMGRVVKVDV